MSTKFLPKTRPGIAALRRKGWTLRPAAKELGVNFTHLHRVLSGERNSRSLLARAAALPVRKEGEA
jgi:lambda repressor-like predicted transcriptional regulator